LCFLFLAKKYQGGGIRRDMTVGLCHHGKPKVVDNTEIGTKNMTCIRERQINKPGICHNGGNFDNRYEYSGSVNKVIM
jgi:hypothetical protein